MLMSRKLYNVLASYGFDVRDDYSGRFMFGKKCFGFVTAEPALGIHLLYQDLNQIAEDDDSFEDEYMQILNILDDPIKNTVLHDNMGLDYIVYLPDIQVEEEE